MTSQRRSPSAPRPHQSCPPPSPLRPAVPARIASAGSGPLWLYIGTSFGVAVGIAVSIFVGMAITQVMYDSGSSAEGVAAIADSQSEPSVPTPPTNPPRQNEKHTPEFPAEERIAPSPNNGVPTDVVPFSPGKAPYSPAEHPSTPRDPPEETVQSPNALADLRTRKNTLILPPRQNTGFSVVPASRNLATIDIAESQKCKLELLGGDVFLGEDEQFDLEVEDVNPDTRFWHVVMQRSDGEDRIGLFSLKDRQLSFNWKAAGGLPRSGTLLRFCLLNVSVGEETETCQLFNKINIDAPRLKLGRNSSSVALPMPELRQLPRNSVRLDVDLPSFPNHKVRGTGWLHDAFSVSVPTNDGNPLFEIKFMYDDSESTPQLKYVVEYHPFLFDDVQGLASKPVMATASIADARMKSLKSLAIKRKLEAKRSRALIERLEINLARNKALLSNASRRKHYDYRALYYATQRLERNIKTEMLIASKSEVAADEFANAATYCGSAAEALMRLEQQGTLHLSLTLEIEREVIELLGCGAMTKTSLSQPELANEPSTGLSFGN